VVDVLRRPIKTYGMTGPIDDAFTDSFMCVRGTGKPWHAATQAYAEETLKRFQADWHKNFRGDVAIKDDTDVTPDDIANLNLVLFGDPSSNSMIRDLLSGLPLTWNRDKVELAGSAGASAEHVPVLSTLAREFAVCQRWFCSVPGETWPNRNFLHAATSDGETNIDIRFYQDKTIFEQLEDHHQSWHIYHDDTPQVWAFNKLWDTPARHANWYPLARFFEHVADGALPSYAFLEPNHRPPLHTPDHDPRLGGTPDLSNSQHPGNNVVPNEQYDGYNEGTDTDFQRAEALIAPVYEALRDPARAVRPPQPGQLGPLGLGQLAGIAARAGLRQPVAERPLVHPEVPGALRNRLTRLDHILDGALTEAVIEPSSCLWRSLSL